MPDAQPGKPAPKETSPQERPDFVVEQSPTKIPEQRPKTESNKEQPREGQEAEISSKITPPTSDIRPPTSDTPTPQIQKTEQLIQIENILEQDLAEAFATMDQAAQMRFKQAGEKTAQKIEQLMRQVKVKVKSILNAIRSWLKIIPGVNKHFIEQETKIKGDKIMALRK